MNIDYADITRTLNALPVCDSKENLTKALANVRKVLPRELHVNLVVQSDGWAKWELTTTSHARAWMKQLVNRIGKRFNGEFYSVHSTYSTDIKGIYYGVGKPRVQR